MKKIKYEFIGWCKEAQSDKVWGAIELITLKSTSTRYRSPSFPPLKKYLIFWGKRGTKYQTRFLDSCPVENYYYSSLAKKIEEKKTKGYKKIEKDKLEEIYPDFEKDLLDLTFWTMMTKTDKLSLEEWEEIKKEIF